MASMQEAAPATIIKSDRVGRTRYSKQYKAEVLETFEASGMSAMAFAARCGVKYATFASWVAKHRRAQAQSESTGASPAFLVAEVGEAPVGAGLEVRLPCGALIRATGSAEIRLLAELLRELS